MYWVCIYDNIIVIIMCNYFVLIICILYNLDNKLILGIIFNYVNIEYDY